MKFGSCSDCNEYKYLKDGKKCPSCLSKKVKIYNIQHECVLKSLEILRNNLNKKQLPSTPNSNYSNMVEELIDITSPSIKSQYILEDVLNKLIKTLDSYISKNKNVDPVVDKSISKLKNLKPDHIVVENNFPMR
jgi:hypothetical protein